jgi:hypothetical protein
MIRYFLKIKCSTTECPNNENSAELWYDNPTVSHPCGICGMMITDCEVLKQAEFEPYPLPPSNAVVEDPIEEASNE